MKITETYAEGFVSSLRAMRNPLDSWDKSDSTSTANQLMKLGTNDKDLSQRLTKAGSEH